MNYSQKDEGNDASLHSEESDMWIWTFSWRILFQSKYCVMSFKDGGFCFGVTVIALCKQVQCLCSKESITKYTLRKQTWGSDEFLH